MLSPVSKASHPTQYLPAEGSGPIVLFDGQCNLCSATVQFLLTHERAPAMRFASLQGESTPQLLAPFGGLQTQPDSILFLENGNLYQESDAALHIAAYLKAPWSWLPLFKVVPRFVRDAAYRFVARNRYRWFGQPESCFMPRPELKRRFLP